MSEMQLYMGSTQYTKSSHVWIRRDIQEGTGSSASFLRFRLPLLLLSGSSASLSPRTALVDSHRVITRPPTIAIVITILLSLGRLVTWRIFPISDRFLPLLFHLVFSSRPCLVSAILLHGRQLMFLSFLLQLPFHLDLSYSNPLHFRFPFLPFPHSTLPSPRRWHRVRSCRSSSTSLRCRGLLFV